MILISTEVPQSLTLITGHLEIQKLSRSLGNQSSTKLRILLLVSTEPIATELPNTDNRDFGMKFTVELRTTPERNSPHCVLLHLSPESRDCGDILSEFGETYNVVVENQSLDDLFGPILDDCAVCLDPLDSEKCIIHLPCGHSFHGTCLPQYACAVCRYKFVNFESDSRCSDCIRPGFSRCLICQYTGCNEHSLAHAKASSHLFIVEIETSLVHDYVPQILTTDPGYIQRFGHPNAILNNQLTKQSVALARQMDETESEFKQKIESVDKRKIKLQINLEDATLRYDKQEFKFIQVRSLNN